MACDVVQPGIAIKSIITAVRCLNHAWFFAPCLVLSCLRTQLVQEFLQGALLLAFSSLVHLFAPHLVLVSVERALLNELAHSVSFVVVFGFCPGALQLPLIVPSSPAHHVRSMFLLPLSCLSFSLFLYDRRAILCLMTPRIPTAGLRSSQLRRMLIRTCRLSATPLRSVHSVCIVADSRCSLQHI